MVYMSGNKAARNQNSIVNRTNVCGGPKKGGLAPSSGFWFLTSNPSMIGATNTQFALKCIGNYTNGSQVAARAVARGMR